MRGFGASRGFLGFRCGTSGKECGRSSVNYLTGKFITYERVKGRVKVSKVKRFVVPSLALLNGFNCNTHDDGVSP